MNRKTILEQTADTAKRILPPGAASLPSWITIRARLVSAYKGGDDQQFSAAVEEYLAAAHQLATTFAIPGPAPNAGNLERPVAAVEPQAEPEHSEHDAPTARLPAALPPAAPCPVCRFPVFWVTRYQVQEFEKRERATKERETSAAANPTLVATTLACAVVAGGDGGETTEADRLAAAVDGVGPQAVAPTPAAPLTPLCGECTPPPHLVMVAEILDVVCVLDDSGNFTGRDAWRVR